MSLNRPRTVSIRKEDGDEDEDESLQRHAVIISVLAYYIPYLDRYFPCC